MNNDFFTQAQVTCLKQKNEKAIEASRKTNPHLEMGGAVDNGKIVAFNASTPRTLHDYGLQYEADSETRFLYLAYAMAEHNTTEIPPYSDIKSISAHVDPAFFYLTNDYKSIDKHVYTMKVALGEMAEFVVVSSNSSKAHADKLACYAGLYGPSKNQFRIYFPMTMTADSGMLANLFVPVTPPIIPLSVRELINPFPASIKPANILEKFLEAFSGFARDYFAIETATGKTKANRRVDIAAGTELYHIAGNPAVPFGTHTNIAHRNLIGYFQGKDKETKREVLDFMRNYPIFDSMGLSTRPPLRVSGMDGISCAKYLVPSDYPLTDNQIKRVFHLVAYSGHHLNDDFITHMHEMVQKLAASAEALKCAMVVWFSLDNLNVTDDERNMDVIRSNSNVDVVTFHTSDRKTIAPKHLDMFATVAEQDPHIVLQYNIAPMFADDLTKAL